MKHDDIKIFNSEIDKRLADRMWSSEIAASVLKREHGSVSDKILNFFAWIMPSLAAACVVYFLIFSRGSNGNTYVTQDEVLSYTSDISDIEFSVIDELL